MSFRVTNAREVELEGNSREITFLLCLTLSDNSYDHRFHLKNYIYTYALQKKIKKFKAC